MRDGNRVGVLDAFEDEPPESAIWRDVVRRLVGRGRSVTKAFALADAVLRVRARRIAEGCIVPPDGKGGKPRVLPGPRVLFAGPCPTSRDAPARRRKLVLTMAYAAGTGQPGMPSADTTVVELTRECLDTRHSSPDPAE